MLKPFSSFAAVLSALILALVLVFCGESITTPLSSTQTPPVTASPVDSGAVTTEKNPDTNPECAHEMTEKIIPPSCTQGYTLHYCKKCSYSYSDNFVEAVGHSYKDVITAPTCTEKGYTTHTCTVCKHSYKDTETAATGHSYGEYVITKEATLTEKGIMTATCQNCPKTTTKSYEHEINATASKGLEYYILPNETVRLKGLGTCTDTVVKVPAITPDGKTVVEIGGNVFKNSKVTRVILPDTVTSINSYAFANAPELVTVNIPKNVETISDYAYQNSPKLTTVYFDAVNCIRTQNQYSSYYASTGATFKELIVGDEVENLPPCLCIGVETLERVTLGKNVKTIGSSCFSGTTALKTILLPEGIVHIKGSAFYKSGLTSLTLPNSLEKIADSAFYQCPIEQTELILPENMSYIGDRAFSAIQVGTLVIKADALITGSVRDGLFCLATIGKVEFPDRMIELPAMMFKEVGGLTSITLPTGITKIPEQFFAKCPDLETVTLPSTVKELAVFTFNECTALKTVVGIENVSRINGSVFAGCSALETVDLSGATYLGEFLFKDSGITDFTFPACITKIPNSFFVNCKSLTSYTIPSHITEVGVDVFRGSGVTELTIPASITTYGQWAFARISSLERVVIEEGVTDLSSWFFSECENLKSVTLPSTLTSIAPNAFYRCLALTEIVIPEGVTRIQDYAFASCTSLTDVTFPSTLQSIGYSAFDGCQLTSLTLPESLTLIDDFAFSGMPFEEITLKGIVTIGSYAFSGCDNLKRVDFGSKLQTIKAHAFSGCVALEEVILPDTLQTIGEKAFRNCSALKKLHLGNNLTSLGFGAFMNCTVLTRVYLPESLSAMKISTTNNGTLPFEGCSPTLTFYTSLETVTPEWRFYFGNVIPNTSYEDYTALS